VIAHNNHPVSIDDANSVIVRFKNNSAEQEISISEIY
jgi:hypothetical protein